MEGDGSGVSLEGLRGQGHIHLQVSSDMGGVAQSGEGGGTPKIPFYTPKIPPCSPKTFIRPSEEERAAGPLCITRWVRLLSPRGCPQPPTPPQKWGGPQNPPSAPPNPPCTLNSHPRPSSFLRRGKEQLGHRVHHPAATIPGWGEGGCPQQPSPPKMRGTHPPKNIPHRKGCPSSDFWTAWTTAL